MDVRLLSAYLPMDRRQAMTNGRELPERARGSALFADIAGFTPLTEALVSSLGTRRGAEELAHILNTIYDPLIAQVHLFGGSVIGFSGDGFLSWFEHDPGLRAAAAGLGMLQEMTAFATLTTPAGPVSLSLKAGLEVGPAQRFLVGNPQVCRFDLLVGSTLDRLARAEHAAQQGELVLGPQALSKLGNYIVTAARRNDIAAATRLSTAVPSAPWPELENDVLSAEQVRPFLLTPVHQRLAAGQGEFLAELRPAVAMFLRFGGLDYDNDPHAETKLDTYVRWVQAVLQHYDGHLLQISTGDKGCYLYISFGTLATHEDDPRRAIAAAMALRQPSPEVAFIQDTQIGLSQGRVWAGSYGSQTRRTYAALGDEVNLAARLMQVAPPGEVRCSGRIHQAASRQWAFENLAPIQVKGKAQAVSVCQPLEPIGQPQPQATGTMVGRQAELETMAQLLDQVRAGRRRVLLLEGEAGIGKSRLLAEFKQAAHAQSFAWLQGAGQSIEQQTPYRAWQDVLAALYGLSDSMDWAERQRRVHEGVSRANPALAERVPLLNDILRLGLPESDLTRSMEPQLRHESLTALISELMRTASGTPLVLALEDAHWLDSLSWELALAVGRALFDQPLLLLLALRPLDGPPPIPYSNLVGLEGSERLNLEAMPAQDTLTLAAARLGLSPEALPTEVANLIQQRAGGNPFFAEELAHTLREQGLLHIHDGDLSSLRDQVPDTVEGVILARIDRLPPEQQLTLKVAAVIGRSFLYRTLRDVHPQRVLDKVLQTHMEDMARRDLTPLEALEPELSYIFKHIIIQQVAYETLLFGQRREIHRVVAEWYEGDRDREGIAPSAHPYLALLVHHYHCAEDRPKECHYARLAGEQAAARFANAEAVRYFSRALELTPQDHLAARYDLLLAREQVHDRQGERTLQSQDLQMLQELTRQLDCNCRQAEVALRWARYYETSSDFAAVIAAGQQAIELAHHSQDPEGLPEELEARGHIQKGIASCKLGDYPTSRLELELALELSRKVERPYLEAKCLSEMGILATYENDYATAKSHHERCLHIYRTLGDRQGEGNTLNLLGAVSDFIGDTPAITRYCQQALHICREVGYRRGESSALINLGVAFDNQGDYTQAIFYYEQALRICREIGNPQGESWALGNLGTALAALGDYPVGQTCYEQSLRLARKIGNRLAENVALVNLSHNAYDMGDYQAGLEFAGKALQIAQELADRHVESYGWLYLGHNLDGMGEREQALQAYHKSLILRQELAEFSLAMESQAALARMCLALGDLPRARAQVEEILGYLTQRTLQGTSEPFRIYLACYHVLQAGGDHRAQELLASAHQLLQERAAKISDEGLRQSFLEAVSVHHEIVTLYEALSRDA